MLCIHVVPTQGLVPAELSPWPPDGHDDGPRVGPEGAGRHRLQARQLLQCGAGQVALSRRLNNKNDGRLLGIFQIRIQSRHR